MTPIIRIASALIAATALLSTIILVFAFAKETPDVGILKSIWFCMHYFTIWTNVFVGLYLMVAVIKGYWPSIGWLTALTLWISIVGLIYHLILAANHHPEGIMAATNVAHHTIVPIGTYLIWLLTKPRTLISKRAPFIWLVFPLGYTAYVLIRGSFDNVYPYFYMDPEVMGWTGVALSQLGFIALFLGLGFLYRFANNWLARKQTN